MSDLPLRELTVSEIDTYRTDGVVCARKLFPQRWVDRMRRAVDRAVAAPTSFGAEVSLQEEGFSGDLFLWKTLDDIRFAPRHATMPLFWSHGLEPGDPLSGPLFPQVLPHAIASEGETRARGPEPPNREHVAAILDEIATTMRRREKTEGSRTWPDRWPCATRAAGSSQGRWLRSESCQLARSLARLPLSC